MEQLELELDTYSFDIKFLTLAERENIKNLYISWKKALDNKIFIRDIAKENIRICNGKYNGRDVTSSSTLHFINCSYVTVVVSQKLTHVTLENCDNFHIKLLGGVISGIDCIRSNNLTIIVENEPIYFIDTSDSHYCNFYISDFLISNIIIMSYCSTSLSMMITKHINGIIKNKFSPPASFFDIYRIYMFDKINDNIELFYYVPNKTDKKVIQDIL